MAVKRRTAGARRTARKARRGTSGLHPVFGPIADPGPEGFGGSQGSGLNGLGGLIFGPIADPGPIFGGLRGSILTAIDRRAMEPAAQEQFAALRVRRLNAMIKALEEQAAVGDEEIEIMSRFSEGLRFDPGRLPPDHGDPAPELRPIEFLRYVHELRAAALQRTIAFLKQSAKAIEAAR